MPNELLLIAAGLLLIASLAWFFIRRLFVAPLRRLTEMIRALRRGETGRILGETPSSLRPLAREIGKLALDLREARQAASEEARMRFEKLDTPWTAERLSEFMGAYLKDRELFIVSNREPYVHTKNPGGRITWTIPPGGVVTALEPVMEATGGMWIAYGGGTADRETVDEHDHIAVPPDEPRYTLRRVWLTPEQVKGYYDGFSNEALWPLCLMAHVRPLFRAEDWREYRAVNGLFAKSVLDEIENAERPLILVQDYQLALVPAMIKKSRPDAQVAMFWHIPWPSAVQFSICPWRLDILEGLLGADLIGFHTQQYCNDFLDTVGAEIEARIDYGQFSITRVDHTTFLKPFPISIAFSGAPPSPTDDTDPLRALGITAGYVGLGVDRLDYTKGIMERFKGIEFFLEAHPEFAGQFTFLQVASPTRTGIERYREYDADVTAEAVRINERFARGSWQPIVLEKRQYSHDELAQLYRVADLCLVTSLHDGMNLVAKEYAAAHDDEQGVLILSRFTGAAKDLKGALLVNPYSAEDTAELIYRALTMPPSEQRRRMKTMRESVRDYNVYRWSAELIKALAQIG